MRLARKFTRQPALAPYVAEEIVPGPQINTDAEFEASIRQTASSNLHPVGTCRMGPNGDTVVDARLARARHRTAARGRRGDHADGAGRQYQRAVDHDRREGRRHDPVRRPRGLSRDTARPGLRPGPHQGALPLGSPPRAAALGTLHLVGVREGGPGLAWAAAITPAIAGVIAGSPGRPRSPSLTPTKWMDSKGRRLWWGSRGQSPLAGFRAEP